jgi:hypothetical protein
MKPDHDFSALRNLIALKKLEMPLDTGVDRFLIELHRRQRAQLLVPESRLTRAVNWLRERAEGFRLVPSLSFGAVAAAVAVAAFIGFAPQAQVASSGGAYQLSLRSPSSNASFAMVPASFSKSSLGAAPKTESLSFAPASQPSATRFILTNPRVAYDATAAF